MSKIGWIDFSSHEQDKVKQVLAVLNEPGTLDELGIGQMRDAFANHLLSWISIIQTQEKYFITIPRLMREIQNEKAKNATSHQQWLELQEYRLATNLVTSMRQGDELENGIIGADIEQGGVSRRPSSIYGNGLKTFGIVHTNLSLNEFCQQLAESLHPPYGSESLHQEASDDNDAYRPTKLAASLGY